MTPWAWLTRHRRAADEVADELRSHTDERADDLIDSGLDPVEAHRRANIELGNRARVLEHVRHVWWSRIADRAHQDLSWTWRGLRARRGRAWLACALLASALAINITAFAIVDAMAFDRAPYPHAGELVVFDNWLPAPALEEWRRQTDVFASVDGYFEGTTFVLGDGPAEHLAIVNVTPGLFDTLRVPPRWGRTFIDADARRLDEQAVIVSPVFARRHFGSPEAGVGRVLQTAAQPFRIVGVMPPSFGFPSARVQIWRAIDPAGPMTRNRAGVTGVGRIVPTVAPAAAVRQVTDRAPAVNAAAGVRARNTHVVPLGTPDGPPGQERIFYVLLGAAACLLLTACVNVLNLELSGSIGRTRMAAIQSALGATRASLVRVTVFESLALVMASGIAAWLLASAALPAVVAGLPARLDYAATKPFALDLRTMAYALAASLCASTIVALPVALYASRLDLSKPLKLDDRSTVSVRTGLLLRRIVTVAQVSLAVLLVIVGALFVRTYQHLMAQPKGFDSRNLVGLSLELPSSFYPSTARLRHLGTTIAERLRSLPGVQDAVDGPIPPSIGMSPTGGIQLRIDGRVAEPPDGRPLAMAVAPMDPGYFKLLGVPLRAGRWLSSDDDPSAVLIGEGFARRFWGTADAALGHEFDPARDGGRAMMWGSGPFRVVGVIGDYRRRDDTGPYAASAPSDELDAFTVRQPPPVEQVAARPALDNGGFYLGLDILARVDSPSRAAALAAAVRDIEPRVTVATDVVDDGYADRYEMTLLLTRVVGAFGVGALLIALVGVYGVMAFLVIGRRREIGIRMALGADRRRVGRFVMTSAMRLVLVGVVVGSAGALLASRAMASLLFGVTATEPSVYVGVAATTVATAMLATWQPMRRAARINPVETLRAE